MFYQVRGLKTTLKIEPQNLDQVRDQNFIQDQIVQKQEGRYHPDVGHIICITKCVNANEDQLEASIEEDGSIRFLVSFEAFTFQLKQNDIVDCEVTECKPECLYASLGPIKIVIARDRIPLNYAYSKECYRNDQDEVIKPGTKLRVAIEKTVYRKDEFKAFARLAGEKLNDLLGILGDELKMAL